MNNSIIRHLYAFLIKLGRFFSHFFLILIRVYWGVLLAFAGYGKWIALSATGAFFERLGFPFPLFTAAFVGLFEVLAGGALVLGLASRLFSLLTIVLFTVAYATAHADTVKVLFSDPSQFTSAAPFLYLYTALVVFCFGPGLFSFDYWLEKKSL